MTAPFADPLLLRVLSIVEGVVGAGRRQAAATADTRLADGFWLDSAELLDIVLACELEFGIVFDDERDFGKGAFDTLGTFAALVRHKIDTRETS